VNEYGTITGYVRTLDGDPIEEASVMVVAGPAHPDVAAITDARGRFQLGNLEPARYTIRVFADGYEPVSGPVRVYPGERARVNVVLANEVVGETNEAQPDATSTGELC
jgi:hypothetical protein